MQVTISGDIGSGKSTVGQYLAEKLDAELIDCGQLYRAYASQKGMSVLQLNQSEDYSIDVQIDKDLVRMGKEGKSRVYISRTAWYFIPGAVHVYMTVDPKLAARRVLNRKTVAEKHDSVDSIIEYNRKRIAEEDARYERMYGITRKHQMAANNVLVCIGNASAEDVCSAVYEVLNKGNVICFDPRTAVPTKTIKDIDPEYVKMYCEYISGNISECPVEMQFVNGIPYILNGHHRIVAACNSGTKMMYTSEFTVAGYPNKVLDNFEYHFWEDFVKGDLSAVTGVNGNDGFSNAVSKMSD